MTEHPAELTCEEMLEDAEKALTNLQIALGTSRRIGEAIGIVMAVEKVDEQAAFLLLSRISQRLNRKLRDIAEDIVLTGSF